MDHFCMVDSMGDWSGRQYRRGYRIVAVVVTFDVVEGVIAEAAAFDNVEEGAGTAVVVVGATLGLYQFRYFFSGLVCHPRHNN